jgi:organic radical activating enzyme
LSGGWIHEVFRSIQGEGIRAGVMQVFVRLSGCCQGCVYCDSAEAKERSSHCTVRESDGDLLVENPVDAEVLATLCISMAHELPGVHSLAVTGGEPLEQPDFLSEFLELFRRCGLPVYLETNGLHVVALGRILHLVDIISLDIKLPSLGGSGITLAGYGDVLGLTRGRDLFVKIVLAEGMDPDELYEAATLIAHFDRSIPLVLQPVTPVGKITPPPPEKLLEYVSSTSNLLADVRLIPQCHRLLGLP